MKRYNGKNREHGRKVVPKVDVPEPPVSTSDGFEVCTCVDHEKIPSGFKILKSDGLGVYRTPVPWYSSNRYSSSLYDMLAGTPVQYKNFTTYSV